MPRCAGSADLSRAATSERTRTMTGGDVKKVERHPRGEAYSAPSIRYGAAFYKGNFYEEMKRRGIPDEDGMDIVCKVTDAIEADLSANPSKSLLQYLDTAQKTWRSLIDEYVAKDKKLEPHKALLIDFDGTQAESRGPEDELLVELGRKYGNGRKVEIGDFEKYWGCGMRELMVRVMKDAGVADYQKAGESCACEYFERFDEILERSRLINPCTAKIVGALRTRMKTAVVSSSEKTLLDRAVSHFKLDGAFDVVVGREAGEKPKPEPDVYLKALSKLDVDAKEAVAVEDTPRGIAAARAAGVGLIVGIRNTHNYDELKDAGADEVIGSLNELLKFC